MQIKASNTTPLAANTSWATGWLPNGEAEVTGSEYVIAGIFTDQPGMVQFQETCDPNNPLISYTTKLFQVPGGLSVIIADFAPSRAWYRVVYSNGSVAQTVFAFQITASAPPQSNIVRELQRVNFQLSQLLSPRPPVARDDIYDPVSFGMPG